MTNPSLTRAADQAAKHIKAGWPFSRAVGVAVRDSGLKYDDIAAELNKRSVKHKRAQIVHSSHPAPKNAPTGRPAPNPAPSSLFDDDTLPANGYGVL